MDPKITQACVQVAAVVVTLAASPLAAQAQTALERGAYLMKSIVACGNCHTPKDERGSDLPNMELAGGFTLLDPNFTAYSKNITPDPNTGIGTWTDAQIIRAIREGITKEGEKIGPPMPIFTYNNMSDDDVKAIVAYLHSVKPIHNEVKESVYKIPKETPPPAKGLPAPPRTDKVAYGGYIVNALAHCFECHTTAGPTGAPDFAGHLGAGGFEIEIAPGAFVRTANITSDPDTGIGKWTDAEIKKAITEGVSKDGHHLSPPMPVPYFKNIAPEDLDAIVAFLRTVPPVKNKVERTDFQKANFK